MDELAVELGLDPIEVRRRNWINARGVPVHHGGRAGVRLGQLRGGHRQGAWSCSATTSCAREQEARRASERPGAARHRHLDLHRDVRPGAVAGARRAALRRRRLGVGQRPDAADRQGRGGHRHVAARPGARDGVEPDRRRPARRAVRRRRGAARRHPHLAQGPGHVRVPLARGRRHRARATPARRCVDKAKPIAAHMLECDPADLEFTGGAVPGARHPGRRQDASPTARSPCSRRTTCPTASSRRSTPTPRLRPGQLLLPARHPPVRGRGRHRDRPGDDPQVRGRRRRRPGDQPADRRGPGARRRRAGHRAGAVRGGRLRRRRQPDDRHVRRLHAADGGRPAGHRHRPHRDARRPDHPLGTKGVGEAGTIASTPAVVNAIVDALRPFGVNDVADAVHARAGVAGDPAREVRHDPGGVRLRASVHCGRGGGGAGRRRRGRQGARRRAEPAAAAAAAARRADRRWSTSAASPSCGASATTATRWSSAR